MIVITMVYDHYYYRMLKRYFIMVYYVHTTVFIINSY